MLSKWYNSVRIEMGDSDKEKFALRNKAHKQRN